MVAREILLEWPLVAREKEVLDFDRVWADRRNRAIVICGAVGVGKSRLAYECIDRIREFGTICRATASRAANAIPLGAISHMLPNEADAQVAVGRGMEITQKFLKSKNVQAIFVDDFHWLDSTSMLLLRKLVDSGTVRLIATAQRGHPGSNALKNLLYDDATCWMELDEFDREQVEQVLSAALGSVGQRTARVLFKASQGNALYLRELVLGSIMSETLADDGQIWDLAGDSLLSTDRLVELITSRLATVPQGWPAVELLALCGSLGLADIESATTTQALVDLDRAGLIQVNVHWRRTEITLSHPLYGEVLRDSIPKLRARALLHDQVRRIERHGARRRDDALRIATWQLAITGTADPSLLTRAAVLARRAGDDKQAVTLLQAIPDNRHSFRSLVTLGTSLIRRGKPEQAEKTLICANTLAKTNQEKLYVVFTRTINLAFVAGQHAKAFSVNDKGKEELTDAYSRRILKLNEGCLAAIAEAYPRALALLDDLEDELENKFSRIVDTDIWLMGALAKSIALVSAGRPTAAVRLSEFACQIRQEREDLTSPLLFHAAGNLAVLALALAESGRLKEARQVAVQAWDALKGSQDPLAWTFLLHYQAYTEWLAGHVEIARQRFSEAISYARHLVPNNPIVASSSSGLVACLAILGKDSVETTEVTDNNDLQGKERGLKALGRAWTLAMRGSLSQAQSLLVCEAQSAQRLGYSATEALLLTDVARFGGAKRVAGRITEIAQMNDGFLAPARAHFATALAADDPDSLMTAADELESLGIDLLAAEAAAAAASAWRKIGNNSRATEATRRACSGAARCQGARTPLMISALLHGMTSTPLTKREHDIALLAANGKSSKEIATHLSISVRTVDNHLGRAFVKLDIANRRELKQILEMRVDLDLDSSEG